MDSPLRAPFKLVAVLAAVCLAVGCEREKPFHFPEQSLIAAARSAGAAAAYDTNNDGRADFFLFAMPDGRIDRIGFDCGSGKAQDIVNLDAIPTWHCRHVLIVLDGFHYDVVKRYYDSGGLRMFHPPSRVIAPYPSMTDLAIADFLRYGPCRAYEAKYFDRRANKIVGGTLAYLRGANEPYDHLLNYRASLLWVPAIYVLPRQMFGKELNDFKRRFDQVATQEMLAYFSSTAGMSTIHGAEGQVECLRKLERLINQILFGTRGLTKVTLISDHGHSYKGLTLLDFKKDLAPRGWRMTDHLEDPNDVAMVKFGLTTYASFYTHRKADLAKDLVAVKGVTLASYAESDAAIVFAPGGAKATVRRKNGRFHYEPATGDPLKLKEILVRLTADKDGYYDAEELLQATATHVYPDPLQRIWRAHFGLVENPADVIASLEDRFCVGSESFDRAIKAVSTHGSLDYTNSVAFIMSTAGPMPPVMRSADVPEHMAGLLSARWPLGK